MNASHLLARLTVCIAVFASSAAPASPLTWTLQHAVFSDGGAAYGRFSVESTDGKLLEWNITTTDGSLMRGFNYVTGGAYDAGTDPFAHSVNGLMVSDANLDRYFYMEFDGSLSSGGMRAILPLDYARARGSWECYNCSPYRTVTGGWITSAAVPEPGSLALLGVGMLAFAGLRRRKK